MGGNEEEFPEGEMGVYISIAEDMGIKKEDFKARKLRKDFHCPHCKTTLKFRAFFALEDCQIKKVKYLIKCGNCKKTSETDWREFKK